MTKLQELHAQVGQSPWLDNLSREALRSGELARWIELGVRGVTSNPTIFQKSVSGSDLYDDDLATALGQGTLEEAYWDLAISDVTEALDVLRPVYDSSAACDGYVSIEVAPHLAHDLQATLEAARQLHARIDTPNLLVKVPATPAGVEAVRQLTAEGQNVNVTLIFSLRRYAEVIEAYLSGLERFAAAGGDPSRVHGVASFFLSRVDTEVDRRLDSIGTPQALELRGRTAVAQAKLAYDLFMEQFSGGRWEKLATAGAHPQRPLWASTSTKNADYDDLLYVSGLMGPQTVNTMPEATLEAVLDHARIARTIDADLDAARRHMTALTEVGVDTEEVVELLSEQGVAAFTKSFDELMQALDDKAAALA